MEEDCISCFSIAMIKHHDQGKLKKEAFKWACGSRGLESTVVELK